MRVEPAILYFLIALSIIFAACSFTSNKTLKSTSKPPISIPFEITNNFIIIKLKINGLNDCKFIFDTGSENSIFFEKEIAELLNFKMVNEIRIMGSDLTKSLTAKVALNVIAGTDQGKNFTTNMLVLNENIFNLDKFFGFHIMGILGNSMFQNKIVEIDYVNRLILIYDNVEGDIDKIYTNIHAQWIDNKPYITALLESPDNQEKVQIKLLFDTGATMSLLLYNARKAGIKMPEKLIVGNLGMGMGGPIDGFIGKFNEIGFDTFKIHNVISHFSTMDSISLSHDESKKDGLVGNVLISKFNIVLDYRNQELYLRPNKSYYKPTKIDRSGMIIIASGTFLNEYVIQEIASDSPASQAGLLPNDKIIRINGLPAAYTTLSAINNMLSNPNRNKLRIVISRQGQRHKVLLYLKDLL